MEKRLQARKRASSLKPSKEIAHTENSKSVKKIELYQNDIEQIMEKYAEEKLAKTYVIKKKYKDQDNEFKAMQGDKELFKKLREELEKNMLKEIDDMQIELQRERREKISELRRRYEA